MDKKIVNQKFNTPISNTPISNTANPTNNATNNVAQDRNKNESTGNINSHNQKPLVYLNGRVNNYPVENILIDEGSSLSLISLKFYNELESQSGKSLSPIIASDSLPKLIQADGITPLTVKGKVQLELKFNNIKIGRFDFIIISETSHNLLVGRDITSAANLTILNDNGTKVIHGTDVTKSNITLGESIHVFEVNNVNQQSQQKLIGNVHHVVRSTLESTIESPISQLKTESEIISEPTLPDHLRSICIGSAIYRC